MEMKRELKKKKTKSIEQCEIFIQARTYDAFVIHSHSSERQNASNFLHQNKKKKRKKKLNSNQKVRKLCAHKLHITINKCNKIRGKSDCNELPMQLFQFFLFRSLLHFVFYCFHLLCIQNTQYMCHVLVNGPPKPKLSLLPQ